VEPGKLQTVPGRKTDVLDCQWIQQLHTYGLLPGSFRPDEAVCVLRSYMRQRAMLVQYAGEHVQHMQKALMQMNVQLHHVISNVTGATGQRIIGAILAGERDPRQLARRQSCDWPPRRWPARSVPWAPSVGVSNRDWVRPKR